MAKIINFIISKLALLAATNYDWQKIKSLVSFDDYSAIISSHHCNAS